VLLAGATFLPYPFVPQIERHNPLGREVAFLPC
jgi:hypothetical protein